MPRYCAVKVCRNRGGSASKQDNKRISFYPFPLQDKSRLQKWVANMKREDWTPSRHQYLCSEHFREDCFDIRWGIRYLKNTAVPTVFPPSEDDGEKKVPAGKRNSKSKPNTSESDTDSKGCDSSLWTRPLILSRSSTKGTSAATNGAFVEQDKVIVALPVVSDAVISFPSELGSCETAGDGGIRTPCGGIHSEQQADSSVTVLCCEPLGPFPDGGANADARRGLQAEPGQAFSVVPMETASDGSTDCFLEYGGPLDGEHVSACEHSYCRPDASEDQLWRKILSLHSKISELDRREESTVAKIRALEQEIALLKRDSAVFKEKQKVLEDFISSVLV